MPHDKIKVSLPFLQKNWLGRQRIKYKTIGFEFTNLMMSTFILNNNLVGKKPKDLNEMVEKNGQNWYLNESFYCAALAYCQSEKMPENFTKEALIKAIILADQETQQKILNTWQNSQTFGASFKKKVQSKVMMKK